MDPEMEVRKFHPALPFIGFVVLSVVWIAQSWWNQRRIQNVHRWKPIPARVVQVTLRDPGLFSRYRQRYGRIQYTYSVHGKVYRSDWFSPVSRNAPYEVAQRYRPGQRIRVYVDPRNPGHAALVLQDPRVITRFTPTDWVILLLPFLAITGLLWILQSLGFPVPRRGPGGWRFY